ncbi:chondroadherin-like [Diabrotica virgifera virgifera]|uniref:Leucine-rich repeat-containing protein 15-like n=1 Tax=Diabrotica virgifera virgifera TaxID=50390 RepID=A0ABM5IK85_DIAVI|nr:chondroadherin-like [Diabrotica virgifera virgifera]
MRNIQTIFYVIALTAFILVEVSGEVLFKRGFYKAHKRGSKVTISDVESIDNVYFPNKTYLKLKAKIPVLFSGAVRRLPNLETLKLDYCEIVDVQTGSFSELPSLKTIALNDNDIEGIKSAVFNHLNITNLYLQRNKISFIETEALDNLPNLSRIKLNYNLISFWDNNWFKNTPQLTELFIRRNSIRSLPSHAFKNLQNKKLIIYLSRNLITTLSPDIFADLKHCSQIWLDRNEIRDIHPNTFSQIESLEVLFLSGNFLSSVPKDLLKNLKNDLVTLDLAHNINLTCIDYEIVKRVKLTNLVKINKLDCDCIKTLKHKLVSANKSYEINSDCYIFYFILSTSVR